MLENLTPAAEIEAAFLENFPITAPYESDLFEFCTNSIREGVDISFLENKILERKKRDGTEVDSENERPNSDSECLTDQLLEEESETETIEADDEEPEAEVSPVDIEERLLDTEAYEEMQDAPLDDYVPLTEPDSYTIDDFGGFLLDVCPKLGLNGEAAALALSKWLSHPSVLSRYALLQMQNNSILEVWKYFEKINEFKDLAIVAQMLLINTASEASCEREFWKQRKILTNERNRTGQELAFTRIVFMTIDE